MSTDYSAVCRHCMRYIHLGQRMADVHSFGYGSNDAAGQRAAMRWIDEHASHGLTICSTDDTPDDCESMDPEREGPGQ